MISVQILRAVAALMVVIFHIFNKAVANGTIVTNPFIVGEAGVDLFFIISGFIMAYITYNKKTNVIDFLSSRLARIIPLYWFITAIALIAYISFPTAINWGGDTEIGILDSFLLIPTKDALLVPVAWTLRYEFLFYFIFTICLLFKENNKILCILVLSTLPLLSFINDRNNWLTFISSPLLWEFALGMLSFSIYVKYTKKLSLLWMVGALALFIEQNATNDFNRVVIYGVPMMFIFIGIISNESMLNKSKGKIVWMLKKCGDASYSIYLTHFFIIGLTSRLLNPLNLQSNLTVFSLMSFIASVAGGFACYIVIEKPLTRKIKLMLSPSQVHRAH